MSFSHTGDFKNFSYLIDIKISQDEGQGRTAPILTNSLEKGACFLQGGLPQKATPGKNFLDKDGNPGKIVTRQGVRRPI